jgi:hypothetical protein
MADMSKSKTSSPLTRSQAVDLYFMEHRAKLIDIAAFLDRLDRAATDQNHKHDFRIDAFRAALQILNEDRSERAKRVLELFSDPTMDPIPKAPMKGALGAYAKSEGR